MGRHRNAQEYLDLGDKLLDRGHVKKAAAAYVRCADEWLAETFLHKAREAVHTDPVSALKALAQVERLVGVTGEGRQLSASAYEILGERDIAARFRVAC
jgi:hypothetical protein